ncbi:MAG: ABC transporter ATP-binding protein [Oscillospiraceae bacterium]|nr:ABC transporter ATP-binding protein [Oscillospiraceae bacterium]
MNTNITKAGFLRQELKGSLLFFICSMLLSAVTSVIDLINPKIISSVIDNILGEEGAGLLQKSIIGLLGGREYIREHLWIPAILIICVALTGGMIRYAQSMANAVGAERFVQKLRCDLFTHTERLPMSWYGKNSTGDILQRCTSDVETVKQFVSAQLTTLVQTVLSLIFSIIFMAGINGRLTLIAMLFMPVIIGYSLYFHGKIGETFMKADTEEGIVSGIVQENLTGIRVVRAFGKERYEYDRFTQKNRTYTDLWIRLMRLMSVFWSLGDLISGLQVLTVVALGAVFCVKGEITAGGYIAFVSYNAMLTWPVRELGRTIADLSRAGVAIDRIRYILSAAPEDMDNGTHTEGAAEPLIMMRSVSFSYDDNEVLHDISFVLHRGEKVGIIGGTGSGKTTLTDVLTRTVPTSDIRGEIIYNGMDAKTIALSEYRREFARVLQEPFLFSGSIAHNIAISDDAISDRKIGECAEDAAFMSSILKFTDGFDTYVGERGVTLSGGQKQRCAIAAALAADSSVLILDDAFSALDAKTDAGIRQTLFTKYRDRAMIIIAHRITTLSGCDRIYVLDKGRIADVGTHEELIARKGIYRDIYELQK